MPVFPRDPEAKAASAKRLGISEEKMRAMESIPMPASQASDQAAGVVGGHPASYSTELEEIPYVPTPNVKDDAPEFLKSLPNQEPITPPNAHVAVLDQLPDQYPTTQLLHQQFRDSDPEKNAKVASLSQKFGQPPEYVAKNLDKAERALAAPAPSAFEEMEKEYPGSTKYFSRPENMAVAHDAVDEVKQFESGLQERGFWGKIADSIASGVYGMGKSLAQAPAVAYQAGEESPEYPSIGMDAPMFGGVNTLAKITPEGREAKKNGIVPKSLYDNEITQGLDLAQRGAAPEELSDSVIKETAKGNYARAGKAFAFQVASNMPQLALILVNPNAGLAALGVASTSGKMADNLEKGVDPNVAKLNALGYGAIETGIESIGGIGSKPLQEMIKNLVKNTGKETAKQVLKEGFKELAKNAAEEGGEEFVTSLAQDTLDWAMGVNPDAKKGMLLRALDATLIGAGSGITMSGPHVTVGTAANLYNVGSEMRSTADKGAYLALGEHLKESKLWKRGADVAAKAIDTIAGEHGANFVYISPKAFEAYFQDKEGGSVKVLNELGALAQFEQNKDSNENIKIPLSTWTRVTLETPHFNALANDVKFDPQQQSVNEVKEDQELAEKLFKVLESEKKAKESDPATEAGAAVRADVAAQLKAIKEDPRAAELYRAIENLARRSGKDPLELYKKYSLRIHRGPWPGQDAAAQMQEPGKPEWVKNLQAGYKYPVSERVSPVQAHVEQNANEILSDVPNAMLEYAKHPLALDGKYIDADIVRELIPEYNESRESRMIHTQSVHSPAVEFAWKMYEELLKRPVNGAVMLMAGGPGAGKSYTIENILAEEIDDADVFYDGTSQDLKSTRQKIEQALATGRGVKMVYIYNTIERSAKNARYRFDKSGRPVPAAAVVAAHVRSLNNIRTLAKEYAGNPLVRFQVFDNSTTEHGERPGTMPVEKLDELRYNKDGETEEAAIARLLPVAEKELKDVEREVRKNLEAADRDFARRNAGEDGPLRQSDGTGLPQDAGQSGGPGSGAQQGRGDGRGANQLRQNREPLPGLPAESPGPSRVVRDAARRYVESAGLEHQEQYRYVKADPARGKRIAEEYAKLQHNPSDPEVIKAYDALIEETLAQYQVIKELGIKVEAIQPGQENPYRNSREMIADLQRGHLWFFPTDQGFGQQDSPGHPLLRETPEVLDGKRLLANDVFRIVHDFFGHAKEGVGFGPHGEENAFQCHVRMYSPLAARAMATETRGQNSWVNFGPMGEANRANPENTVYAEQKAGLLPEWVMEEGVETALFQSPIGFFSQVEKEIEKMDFKAMPAKDLWNRIKNIQGLKAEELEFLGLEDFLHMRSLGKDVIDGAVKEGLPNKVTKEEVLEYVKQNGLQVEQIVLSEDYSGRDSGDSSLPTPDELSWDDGKLAEPDYDYLSESAYERLKEDLTIQTGSTYSSRKWIYDLEGQAFLDGIEELRKSGDYNAERVVEKFDKLKKEAEEQDDGSSETADFLESARRGIERYIEYELHEAQMESERESYYDGGYGLYTYTEKETEWTLEGWSDNGEWYSPDTSKTYRGNIEEAKVQLLEAMIDKGLVRVEEDEDTDGEADPSNPNKPVGLAKWDSYVIDGGNNYREVLITLPKIGPEKFTYGTHWDDRENIVAHVRLTDRVGPKGEKVLQIEEIQSDWHQQGRESGYRSPDYRRQQKASDELGRKNDEAREKLHMAWEDVSKRALEISDKFGFNLELGQAADVALGEKAPPSADAHAAFAEDDELQGHIKKYNEVKAERKKASDDYLASLEQLNQLSGAVPDAPFKQTDAWAALTLKRVIRLAAEEGYGMVALSPAEVHVKRWGTDAIVWGKGKAGFELVDQNGTLVDGEIYDTKEEADAAASAHKAKSDRFEELKAKFEIAKAKANEALGDASYIDKQAWMKEEGLFTDADHEEFDELNPSGYRYKQGVVAREIPDHFKVTATEQRGGFANGFNIEERARAQGKLLERRGERVTTKEELRDVIASSLGRERNDRSLESLTESVWKQMQGSPEGLKAPRQEGMEFFYDSLLPRKVLPPILKKLDPSVKVGVTEIVTSAPRVKYKWNGPAPTVEKLEKLAGDLIAKAEPNGGDMMNAKLAAKMAADLKGGKSWDDVMADLGHEYRGNVNAISQNLGFGGMVKYEEPDKMNVLGFPITEKMKEKALGEGFSLFQGERDPLGVFYRDEEDRFNIALLKNANKSTFIHETGHFFMRVMGDLVKEIEGLEEKTEQQQQLVKDYETLTKWAGAEDKFKLKTEHHEKLARGFEQYIFEGKLPSEKLRRIFATFRTWLIAVYKAMGVPDAELSDDVRDVMARLIAAEEEVDTTRTEMNQQPLFSDPKFMGMSLEKTKAYLKAADEAREYAIQEVNRKLQAHHAKVRSQEYKREREILRPEIEAEVAARPVYQAIEKLQETKLNWNSVFEYGKDVAKGLPKGVVATKKSGDGVPVEMAAELLGMSPQELISGLTSAEPKEKLIDRLTDDEMARRHPDLLETGMDEEVVQAVHNASRAKMLRMELEHLASNNMPVLKEAIRRVARRVPTDKAIRAQAQKTIGAKPLDSISPYDYQRAEARAAKEAGVLLAEGNVEGAFEAKLRELLNHELYLAATNAKEEVEKLTEKFEKLNGKDEKIAKGRDMDLVNAARAILAKYGIGKQPAEQNLELIERYDPETFETVKALVDDATQFAGTLDQMSYDQFLGMADSVLAIWELARNVKTLEIDGKKMDRDEVIQALAKRANELAGDDPQPGVNRAMTDKDKRGLAIASLKSLITRVEHWAYAADKGDLNGAFTKFVVRPVLKATTAYRNKRVEVMKELAEIVKGFESQGGKIAAPELKYEFTKPELLMAILHSGNDSNLEKLLGGREWGEILEDGTVDRGAWDEFMARMWREGVVTKNDMDHVQKIWNLNEKLKPAAQKAHKKMYGYYFSEITANPITTPWGVYPGGYMPALADHQLSVDADIRKSENDLKDSPAQMFPTTGRGFTKSRVQKYRTPLSLDFTKIKNSMDKVLRFTFIEPAVKDSARLLNNKDLRGELNRYDASLVNELLMPWLKRAATQKAATPGMSNTLDRGLQIFRKSASLQFMVLNVVNALQNTTSFFPALTRVSAGSMAGSMKRYLSGPGAYASVVQEQSEYMKSRIGQNSQELVKDIDDFVLDPSKFQKVKESAIHHGYVLDRLTNGMMEVIIWGAAYDEHFAKTQNHDESVQYGDATVRQAIAGMNPEDVSRAETGSPFVRLFTMFSTFFNTQQNLLRSELAVARETSDPARAAKAFALVVSLPAIASALIFRVMAGKGLDEDDDGSYIDDFFDLLFGSQFRLLTAMTPGGSILNSAINRLNNKPYDDKINLSPAFGAIDKAIGAPFSVAKAAKGKGPISKSIQEAATALGLITGFPVAPLAKPLSYAADVKQRKIRPTGPIDAARGLVTGQGKK